MHGCIVAKYLILSEALLASDTLEVPSLLVDIQVLLLIRSLIENHAAAIYRANVGLLTSVSA